MYYRKSNSRHRVEWNPANESAAIEALIETSDTGVSAENEVPTEEKIKLSRDVAESVNGDDKRHTGSDTATVSIDNSTKQVDIVDGVGELQITTDKNVGAVVNVRAIELNGSKAVSSDKIEVDVI